MSIDPKIRKPWKLKRFNNDLKKVDVHRLPPNALKEVDTADMHLDGLSMVPLLNKTTSRLRDSLYFEMGYTRAVRIGSWKLLGLNYPKYAREWTFAERKQVLEKHNSGKIAQGAPIFTDDPNQPFSYITLVPGGAGAERASYGKYTGYSDAIQLYNLADDPGEQTNLASNPKWKEKLEELKTEWQRYVDELPGHFRLGDW
jgi:hypothetical protein